jgi:dolichol-phosphate mannosyltransferase
LGSKLVIIPTYNEKENISKMIKAVMEVGDDYDLLIVDDGSPDGTAEIVKALQVENPKRVHLIERSGKLGLGTAYIAGFKYGIDKGYDFLFEMDADFSHNPADLPRLHAPLEQGFDFSIGSRYVKGGATINWPFDREILSRGASLYVRMTTWMPIMDPTAGFICYKREVLETLDLDKIKFVGYAFQIEMKFSARSLGFKSVEVPITFTDRVEGTSKMSKGIISEAILGVLKMKLRSFNYSYRKESLT